MIYRYYERNIQKGERRLQKCDIYLQNMEVQTPFKVGDANPTKRSIKEH